MASARQLSIVVTHPIQHFVPLYRGLAAHPEIDLTVLFGAPIGISSYFDVEMQTQITWQMDMLGGYDHIILEPDQGDVWPSLRMPSSRKVSATLSRLKPECVIIYGYAQINALRALAWCFRNRVPALMIGDSELIQPRSWIKRAIKRLVVPRLLGRFAGFLSVGDHNDGYYLHYGARPDQIFRAPFTIDETAFRAADERRSEHRKAVREQYGIPQDAMVSLFVGKLSPLKRAGDLLDAMAVLAREGGEVKHYAILAGNGVEMEGLARRVQSEGLPVALAGFVNVDQLPALYAASDMLVHPSEVDRHPLICSEAACLGLPLILSDKVGAIGPTDIAREGQNTLVFPARDVTAIADAIRRVGSDVALRMQMSAASRRIFAELDLSRSVSGIIKAIDHVRSGSSR